VATSGIPFCAFRIIRDPILSFDRFPDPHLCVCCTYPALVPVTTTTGVATMSSSWGTVINNTEKAVSIYVFNAADHERVHRHRLNAGYEIDVTAAWHPEGLIVSTTRDTLRWYPLKGRWCVNVSDLLQYDSSNASRSKRIHRRIRDFNVRKNRAAWSASPVVWFQPEVNPNKVEPRIGPPRRRSEGF